MKKEKWDYWNMKSGVQQLTDEIVKSLKEDPRVTIVTNTPCTQLDFQDKKIVVCIIALSFLGGGEGEGVLTRTFNNCTHAYLAWVARGEERDKG